MIDYDCTTCGQDLRLPPIDPKAWRALVLIASIERRHHGPHICKPGCRVCRAYGRLGTLARLQSEPRAPRRGK